MPTKDEIQVDVYTDADWAGCAGTTVHFGARTQAVVALSSAESELYAFGNGSTTREQLFT